MARGRSKRRRQAPRRRPTPGRSFVATCDRGRCSRGSRWESPATILAASLRFASLVVLSPSFGGCLAGCTDSGSHEEGPNATGGAGTLGYTGGAAGNAGRAAGPAVDWSSLDRSTLRARLDPADVTMAHQQADALVEQLTLSEKLSLVHGAEGDYVGAVVGVPRLGIPALTLQDGPAGVTQLDDVTAFPAPIALAATFDRELVELWGAAMGREQRTKGVAVQLAPMINLARVPAAGRNFESFGEDPYLCAELTRAAVTGIQSQRVIATAKHFVGNEQETDRTTGSSEIDERTLHEIYYAPFEAAVAAGVGAVMCSYNRVGGTYACEHPTALADLKEGLGFSGWVMSDWGATHSGVEAANAGLDMEMPGSAWFGAELETAVGLGTVSETRLDDMVRRILTSAARIGLFEDPPVGSPSAVATSVEHVALALRAATSSMTLLKNESGALPLEGLRSLAVIGAAASAPIAGGGGSAAVRVPYVVAPLQAIEQRAGTAVTVVHTSSPIADDAAAIAAAADAALVVLGVESSEGLDRPSLDLGDSANALVDAVAAVNSRTIVVLHTPGAVLMPWLERVSAVVIGWYPGQENGHALASVLFGDTSPTGKLPVSFPASESDLPLPDSSATVSYTEGLEIGYRRLDTRGLAPLFSFGHGLSYTTFEYSDLSLNQADSAQQLQVAFDVTNTGAREGTETPQLYLEYPDAAEEPPRVLRGFSRVELAPGDTRHVVIPLGPREFRVYDPSQQDFDVPSGTYRIRVGSSSRDLRLETVLTVVGTDGS